jgi:hypothetical protein
MLGLRSLVEDSKAGVIAIIRSSRAGSHLRSGARQASLEVGEGSIGSELANPGRTGEGSAAIAAKSKPTMAFKPGRFTDEIDSVELYSMHYEWLV